MITLQLSHSQLEAYGDPLVESDEGFGCQKKWGYDKVYHAKGGPAMALMRGIALHEALQVDLTGIKEKRDPLDFYDLAGAFRTSFAKARSEQDPHNLYSPRQYRNEEERSLGLLSSYCEKVQPGFIKTEILAIEEWLSFTVTGILGDEEVEIELRGRLDVATIRAICDFKTASRPWPYGIEHFKEQADAYFLGVQNHPNPLLRQLDAFTFIVFSENAVQMLPTRRTPTQLEAFQRKVFDIGCHMIEAKRNKDFKARPGNRCRWCGYQGICTEGQTYIQRTGASMEVPIYDPVAKFRRKIS